MEKKGGPLALRGTRGRNHPASQRCLHVTSPNKQRAQHACANTHPGHSMHLAAAPSVTKAHN